MMTVHTLSPDELEALLWTATVAGIEPKPQITSHFRNGVEFRRELILAGDVYEARIPVAEVSA